MTTELATRAQPITAVELRALLDNDSNVRLLDVRTGAEFETAHIAGSCNVPLDVLAERVRDLAGIDRPVVVVCQSGNRATEACRHLHSAGGSSFRVLDGGIGGWQRAGGEVEVGASGRWALERQVRLVAGSLVLASVLTSTVVPRAKWLAAGVGAGLTFSAVTDTCAMGLALTKLPYNRAAPCDVDAVIAELSAPDRPGARPTEAVA